MNLSCHKLFAYVSQPERGGASKAQPQELSVSDIDLGDRPLAHLYLELR